MTDKVLAPRDRGLVDPDLPHAYAKGEAKGVCCYCGDYPGEPIHTLHAAKMLNVLLPPDTLGGVLELVIAHFEGALEYWGVVQTKYEDADDTQNPDYQFAQASTQAFDEVVSNLRLMRDSETDGD